MIVLRQLEEKDAGFMLEWMHDEETQQNFRKNMLNVTLEEATDFCREAKEQFVLQNGKSIHMAIADNVNDEYLGTISLKKIDLENKSAEYAISLRKKARGKGIAKKATGLILKKAFEEYGLHRVYLNVLESNEAAIQLYERCGFVFEGEFRDHLFLRGEYETLKWYAILEREYQRNRTFDK